MAAREDEELFRRAKCLLLDGPEQSDVKIAASEKFLCAAGWVKLEAKKQGESSARFNIKFP
jgi:hypothetical protein